MASLALQQMREVGAAATQEDVNVTCSFKVLFYIVLALSISILGLVSFVVLYTRKLRLCRGQLFSNAVKIMLFISDVQFYVPIKLCKTVGINHRYTKTRKCKIKMILYLGCYRSRLEGGQHDF